MNLELPDIATDVGATAARAFADAAGVDLARRAEVDPAVRTTVITPLLNDLGVFDLTMGDDPDIDLAAGELCRAAGRIALPYPIAAVLGSPEGAERPLALVDPARPRADHGDLFATWLAASLDGRAWVATSAGDRLSTKLGPFVTDLRLGNDAGAPDVSATLVLGAWYLTGVVERALELAVEHVSSRQQFGHALAGFQSVQFQVADVAVAAHSLRELARYTMWKMSSPGDRLVDALALRVQSLETATQVLRACTQLHGAIGLCDEHDLSMLTRHAQPLLRQPYGLEATTERMVAAISDAGFDSLFGSEGTA
jgi:acyl-CoA dehydrogenase